MLVRNCLTKVIRRFVCFFFVGILTYSHAQDSLRTWDLNGPSEFAVVTDQNKDTIVIKGLTSSATLSCVAPEINETVNNNSKIIIQQDSIIVDGSFVNKSPRDMIYNLRITLGSNVDKKLSLSVNKSTTPPPRKPRTHPLISHVQFPYYDAISLSKGIGVNDILAKYNATRTSNAFLEGIPLVGEQRSTSTDVDGNGLLSSIGGLDVTQYVDGLAKFLVKRTKQELSISFFEKFKTTLEQEPDMLDLFPATSSTLLLIDKEIYNYDRYITTLREQFKSDLSELPTNFPKIIDNHEVFFNKHPGLDVLIKSCSAFTEDLLNHTHPGVALSNFATNGLDTLHPHLVPSIKTLQLFSAGIRDTISTTEGHYWVPNKSLQLLLKDANAFKIFIGLISEQAKGQDISFQGHQLGALLTRSANTITNVEKFITDLSVSTDRLNALISANKGSGQLTLAQAISYFDASLDIFEQSAKVKDIFPALNISNEKVELAVNVSRTFADLISNISIQKFGASIIDLVKLYQFVISDKSQPKPGITDKAKSSFEEAIDKIRKAYPSDLELISSAKKLDFSKLKNLYPNIKGSDKGTFDIIYNFFQTEWVKGNGSDITAKLLKYASFMAAIAQAEDSDAVAATIEAYALPNGSARIKRLSKKNTAINAFVGPYVGYELETDSLPGSAVVGITAPVGVAFSSGMHGDDKNKSHSLFISLIDIGAVVAYRFSDNENDTPKIFLKEIFSPGLFFSASLGNVTSLNIGAQMAPRLRKIGDLVNEVDIHYKLRGSVSLVVDIPIFNLHTKD